MKECTKLKKQKSHILFKKVQLTSNKQENIKIPFKIVISVELKTYGFYRAVESKLIVLAKHWRKHKKEFNGEVLLANVPNRMGGGPSKSKSVITSSSEDERK